MYMNNKQEIQALNLLMDVVNLPEQQLWEQLQQNGNLELLSEISQNGILNKSLSRLESAGVLDINGKLFFTKKLLNLYKLPAVKIAYESLKAEKANLQKEGLVVTSTLNDLIYV